MYLKNNFTLKKVDVFLIASIKTVPCEILMWFNFHDNKNDYPFQTQWYFGKTYQETF